MADGEPTAKKVEDIRRGALDSAGYRIVSVYSYNPPVYAIYRTSERLIVQFSDDAAEAQKQRQRISPLAPMRGQVNALIDGWRKAGLAKAEAETKAERDEAKFLEDPVNGGWVLRWRGAAQSDANGFKRACEYDRRVADALITVLDCDDGDAKALETAQTLLAQVKNDILAERTAIARINYVRWALMLVGGMILTTTLLAGPVVRFVHAFPPSIWPVWTAIAGGSLGAFFSAAVALKGRTLAIDLQWRENLVDITLRILIGAVAGGVFYALLRSGFVSVKLIDVNTLTPGDHRPPYSDFNVFMTGFLAGFIERLVPQLLNDTNIGTPEPAGKDTPTSSPPGGGGKGDAEAKGGKDEGKSDDKGAGQKGGAAPTRGPGSGSGGAAPAGPAQPPVAPPADPTGGTG
ncbi:hypothetical protein OF829_00635 [Sphingomonas sp. LB-2]|uniref:hypothetical protein n=1 Tax=Sphingomonas caeni TaxID=2984949 RepID=UPI0022301CE4|nr:hypothetical protein [Sphingomonas caeni]MCW3845727.1 hypothetical protein [Sphingomonas caeni]